MKLYTYENNRLTPAPTFVTIDGVPYSQPTQATLRRAGIYAYPLATESAPTPPEGKVAVPTGYEVRDGAWHRTYRYDDAPPPPRTFSKYRLVRALQANGVWDRVKAWLEATPGAYDLYLAAEDISGDEQLLSDGIAAAKEAFGWTDEQVAAVLDAAAIGGAS
jgi:hypothetical protein